MTDDATDTDSSVPEGFEPWQKGKKVFREDSDPIVRLNTYEDGSNNNAHFRLSPGAYEFLGEPDEVRFFLNRENNQVAFAPSEGHPDGYAAGNRTVSGEAVINDLGIPSDGESYYLMATTDEDRRWLLIDLTEATDGDE